MNYIKEKISLAVAFIAPIGFIFLIAITHDQECAYCEPYKPIFLTEIKGKVFHIYTKYESRPVDHIVIKNWNDSLIDVAHFYTRNLLIGDVVFKDSNSLTFSFYRTGKFVDKINIDCNCSYAKNSY